MAIDFTFPEEVEQVRYEVRKFCDEVVRPAEALIEARFADGADEVHQWRIAQRAIEAFSKAGSVSGAAGDLPL